MQTNATKLRLGMALVGSALVLSACAGAQATAAAKLNQARALTQASLDESAPEKAYTVLWWHKVEGTSQRPYKPVELAAPEFDPTSGKVFAATRDGFVTAFSEKGERLWEREIGGPFNAGPLFADGTLYVASASGQMAALDPVTGETRWTYSTPDAFLTRPVVAGDLVLAMTAADTLLALDRATGTWRWQYKRDLPPGLTLFGAARPAVRGDRVFAGFADGHAVALDLKTGGVLWEKELSRAKAFRDLDADPVIDERGNVYFASNSDGLFCLDAATGEARFSQLRPGLTVLALNEAGDKIYAGGQGFVGLFETTGGKMRWGRELTGDAIVTGLTPTNGQLIAVSGAHPMLIIEEETGRVRRAFQPGHGVSAPARAGNLGEAFVLSNRGYLYGLALHP